MRRERGLAAITAILIVAVAATAATIMLAQQSAVLDQTLLVASRAQADQYARAGLDWARGTILEDTATSNAFDSLGEAWAKPIVGLPVDRAIVSGAITDEQGKFNLNNLVKGTQKSPADLALFQRLLASQGLAPELADAVLDWIDPDDVVSGAGAEDAYYLSLPKPYRAANAPMLQVEELYRVRGFDAAAVAKLRPLVTALTLPSPTAGAPLNVNTAINVNTAPQAVLEAALPEVPKDKIAQLVKVRGDKPLTSQQAINQWAGVAIAEDRVTVRSAYFSVLVRVAQDDVELATDALISRASSGPPAIIWRRPRY
ncbi:MAG: type II secretion system minor pseudopilin GspK [Usitatibacter sp.]